MRVMIVEDQTMIRSLLESYFRVEGTTLINIPFIIYKPQGLTFL